LETGAVTGLVPVTEKVIPVPGRGEVTVMVPVAKMQVGCVRSASGAAGA
jgi:hypothetical protein